MEAIAGRERVGEVRPDDGGDPALARVGELCGEQQRSLGRCKGSFDSTRLLPVRPLRAVSPTAGCPRTCCERPCNSVRDPAACCLDLGVCTAHCSFAACSADWMCSAHSRAFAMRVDSRVAGPTLQPANSECSTLRAQNALRSSRILCGISWARARCCCLAMELVNARDRLQLRRNN